MVATLESARTASAAGPRSHLTIVGEISAVLCRRGTPEAALELDRLSKSNHTTGPTVLCDDAFTSTDIEAAASQHRAAEFTKWNHRVDARV